MTWYTADYVILSASAIAGAAGLFIGFSGALAFLAATVVGAFSGKLFWAFSAEFLVENWSRGLATLVFTIVAFGLIRWVVRKFVNGLLKQPADSIFGFLVAAAAGLIISFVAIYSLNYFNIAQVQSTIVTEAMTLV